MSINYKSPLHIQWNVDEGGNPITEEILNEPIVVTENKAYLKQIPEKYYRINIAGMVEMDRDKEIKRENEFKCDYETGALYFHHSKEGKIITVTKYNGRGVIMYPSSRIYSKIKNGEVTETLETLIDSSNNKIQEFSDAESHRKANEATRISQENLRSTSETDRKTAENNRATTETKRRSAETKRATAESKRQSAENSRKAAENTRVAKESSRITAESDRINAEDDRKTSENNRISAETDRTNAENNRVAVENKRVSAEQKRAATETSRAKAEQQRENADLLREQHMKVIPKKNVATYADIATTYPNPKIGWLVNTIESNKWWRYDGSTWINVATYSSDALNALVANQKKQYSTPQTTQQPITSFDSDTKDAKVLYEIEGQSGNQILKNGNFDNGTTGWATNSAKNTAEDGKLINTCVSAGISSTGTAYSYFMDKPSDGTKIYISSTVKVTNNNCTKISLHVAGALGIITLQSVFNPVENKEYLLRGIASSYSNLSGDSIRVYIVHYYDDPTTANGKVMEIMGGENGVMCIDMGKDSSHPLYNKTAEEMNAMFPTYFEGMGHSTVDLQTESKNLFNTRKQGYLSTGNVTVAPTENGIRVSNSKNTHWQRVAYKYKLKPHTTYTFTRTATLVSGTSALNISIIDGDANPLSSLNGIKIIKVEGSGKRSALFTTPYSGEIWVVFFSSYRTASITTVDYTEIQIEQGTTSTPYQPYKSKTLQPNITLRSLPIISDKLRNAVLVDGKLKALECAEHVKNTDEYTLQSGDITNYITSYANIDYVRIAKKVDSIDYNNVSVQNGQVQFGNYGYDIFVDDVTKENKFTTISATGWGLIVPKNTYSDLAGAQADLAGTIVNYQLATPITTKLPNQPELWSYKDGRLIDNSTIKPKITYSLAQNLTAQSQSNTEVLQKHEEHLKRLDNKVLKTINQQTQTLTNSSPTEHIMAKQNCGVDVEVGGSMVVNVLGRDGDFSNGNAFNGGSASGRTTTIKNGELVVTSKGDGSDYFLVERSDYNPSEKPSTYYAVCGEMNIINNENVTNAKITPNYTDRFYDLSTRITKNANITKLNQWQKIGTKFKTRSDMDASAYMAIANISDSTTNAQFKVRNIMSVEITEDEYNNLTVDQLLAKYPYVNGAQPLLNPTVEVRGKNLFDGKIGFGKRITVGDFGKKFSTSSTRAYTLNPIQINNSNNITIQANINNKGFSTALSNFDGIYCYDKNLKYIIRLFKSPVNLNIPDNTVFIGVNFADTVDITSVECQIEVGTTPTPYQPYQGGQIIFPTELAKIDTYQDKLTYKDGVAKVDRKVKHVVLDGSLDVIDFCAQSGFKRLGVSLVTTATLSPIGIKYDGKKLLPWQTTEVADSAWLNGVGLGFYITAANTDSGWGENYTPDVDEIKAYFNGWQMNNGTFGTPYNNSETPTWIPLGDSDNTRAVTTVPTTVSPTIEDGTINHYQLYYALEEPIQEEIQPIILGYGVNLVEGQNTLTVKSGFVWEKANPVLIDNLYEINRFASRSSLTKYKAKHLVAIYRTFANKEGSMIKINDTASWNVGDVYDTNWQGFFARISKDDFESVDRKGSSYYVLYQALQEDYNCQVQQAKVSYEDNIRGAMNELVETVANLEENNRQLQATILDLTERVLKIEK